MVAITWMVHHYLDGSPGEVVVEVELSVVGAVGNQAFQLYALHRRKIGKYNQLERRKAFTRNHRLIAKIAMNAYHANFEQCLNLQVRVK